MTILRLAESFESMNRPDPIEPDHLVLVKFGIDIFDRL